MKTEIPEIVENLHHEYAEIAGEIVKTQAHRPVIILDPHKETAVMIDTAALFTGAEGKEEAARRMADIGKTMRPEIGVFISEAWAATIPKGQPIPVDGLEGKPGTIEIVAIQIEQPGRWYLWSHKITILESGERRMDPEGDLTVEEKSAYRRFVMLPENLKMDV